RGPLDRRAARARRPAPLHRLPPGLEAARPAADACRDALARTPDRARQRAALRIHGQRARPRGAEHLLPRLRGALDRARLVRAGRLEPGRARVLPGLRRPLRRRVRGPPGWLGGAPAARPPRRCVRARTRSAAAAGAFYPADAGELRRAVDGLLAAAPARAGAEAGAPAAVVAPHAGYVYAGATAAAALALLPRRARVALLGPSHVVPLDGCAVSGADGWETPLGVVPVAPDLRDAAVAAGAVVDDRPHARDHALEVELPFLQRVCVEGLEILPVA